MKSAGMADPNYHVPWDNGWIFNTSLKPLCNAVASIAPKGKVKQQRWKQNLWPLKAVPEKSFSLLIQAFPEQKSGGWFCSFSCLRRKKKQQRTEVGSSLPWWRQRSPLLNFGCWGLRTRCKAGFSTLWFLELRDFWNMNHEMSLMNKGNDRHSCCHLMENYIYLFIYCRK